MKITALRVNRLENPLGFQLPTIRLSYAVEDTAAKTQQSARVELSLDESFGQLVYDSGIRSDINPVCWELPFAPAEMTRYYWRVTVTADNGATATSAPAWFETAKDKASPWAGIFITQSFSQAEHPILFKSFTPKKEVRKARCYMLGLGIYELYLNEEKVSDEVLLPGIHAYDSWLQYQTFALSVKPGENTVSVMLGDGWYKGAYGLKAKLPRHGSEHALIAEIHLTYEDGSEEVIPTDLTWQAVRGNVTFDSIYDGEVKDARLAPGTPAPVQAAKLDTSRLEARLSPPIRVHERLTPTLLHTPAGETVLDFGQNLVGWVEFTVDVPRDQVIKLSYGEILQNDNFYRDNMRTALCAYTYISNGKKALVRPHFTFFGFRYVKVEGIENLNPADFTACVIHSAMEETGKIVTDSPLINRLLENVRWGQKGNFLDIPTDCPQRDERMGWTGDAQIFADTASFNMDTYAFYTKFLRDLQFEQEKCGGSVPYVVPMSRYELHGATVWGDAATVIPWQTYLHFGDKAILTENYHSMKAWVDYMKKNDEQTGSTRLWKTGRHFGDWLALDGKVDGGVYGSTDKVFIATAYYHYSASLVAKAAAVLGKDADAAAYKKLAEEVKAAFQKEFLTSTGRLAMDTQTGYALAVDLGLVPEHALPRLREDFKEKLKDNNFKLNTGFVGTPALCPALSKCGWDDYAWQLLFHEDFPGWLYEVKMGATTIWERWNSVLPDGSISGTGMNSLNHYAYGSVAAWIYRNVAGIRPVEEAPGFQKALIAPSPNRRLKTVDCSLITPAGRYESGWELRDGALTIKVAIPFNATATLVLPRAAGQVVDGLPEGTETAGEDVTLTLSAGSYRFTYTPCRSYRQVFNMDSNLPQLMEIPETREIILKHFPRAAAGIPFQGEGTTVDEIAKSPFAEVSDEALTALEADLQQLVLSYSSSTLH